MQTNHGSFRCWVFYRKHLKSSKLFININLNTQSKSVLKNQELDAQMKMNRNFAI